MCRVPSSNLPQFSADSPFIADVCEASPLSIPNTTVDRRSGETLSPLSFFGLDVCQEGIVDRVCRAPTRPQQTAAELTRLASAEKPKQSDLTAEVPDAKLEGSRSSQDQARLYDAYSALIPSDKLRAGKNQMNIVGIRHHDPSKSKNMTKYDDRFVVLWKDDKGDKRAQVFEGTTHPGQRTSPSDRAARNSGKSVEEAPAKFTETNGDGLSDMAWIKPGTYHFTYRAHHRKYGAHLRPKGAIRAWRDTNNDGRVTGAEMDTTYDASSILFHRGGRYNPFSAGCQTMHPDKTWPAFIKLIEGGDNKTITYTLVDGKRS